MGIGSCQPVICRSRSADFQWDVLSPGLASGINRSPDISRLTVLIHPAFKKKDHHPLPPPQPSFPANRRASPSLFPPRHRRRVLPGHIATAYSGIHIMTRGGLVFA